MTTETTKPATGFAAEFRATKDEWLKAAEAGLKGRPLDPVLHRRTIDGVPFEAIVERRTAEPIAGRAPGAPWIAMTRIDIGDPEAANAQALEDLNNGATGLSLVLAQRDGGDGVVADTLDRLDRTLKDVLLDLAPIHVEIPHFEGRTTAALFAALVERRGLKPSDVTILFGLDLFRDLSRTGALSLPWEQMAKRSTFTVKALLDRGFVAPVLMMDQRPSHDAGASETQELAAALSAALEHIRVMSATGLSVEAVANTIAFGFSADADQFATIAKFRAARLVWAAVRRELGLADRPVHIHAETSRRMMTRNDAQTNIVRTTVAAFAAGVGGADSVAVLPFTSALGGLDGNARRIARNAQSIVLEETNAYRVADPAAGAGAIDALTDGLAERAWELFRQIEKDGGMFAAMTSGSWQEQVKQTRDARAKAVAARKTAVVGVSEFPKADEAPIAIEQTKRPEPAPRGADLPSLGADTVEEFQTIVEAFKNGASVADIQSAWKPRPTATATPLDLRRVSASYEDLRSANEAKSQRPAAFLALVGPIARHNARAGFIRNLLAAGGVAAIDGPVDQSADELANAYAQSGAPLAIVCGADDDYAEAGVEAVKALRAKGAVVWLAGRPKDGRETLEGAGVTRFVAAGDDALEILTEASSFGGEPQAKPAGGAR